MLDTLAPMIQRLAKKNGSPQMDYRAGWMAGQRELSAASRRNASHRMKRMAQSYGKVGGG